MSTALRSEERVARKHHWCSAWEWFSMSNYGKQDVTPDEWLVIEGVMADSGRILPGQKYVYQSGVADGEFYEFKARLDMHNICLKYDLYPED